MTLNQVESQLAELNTAPLVRELWVRGQASAILSWLDAQAHSAQVWRLRAQALALLDWSRSLQAAQQALQWAARHPDEGELLKLTGFLQQLDTTQAQHLSGPRVCPSYLQAAIQLAACESLVDLQQKTVEWALRLSGLPALAWIEPQPLGWEARCWQPVSSWPRYSEQLLNRCRTSLSTLYGDANKLGDSRSLVLSDLRNLLVVPIQWQQQFYAVLYGELSEPLTPTQTLASLEYLSAVAGAVAQRLREKEQARLSFQQSQMLQKLRSQVISGAPFGLAWADAEGHILEYNSAFAAFWEEPPSLKTPLWLMFSGSEQHHDRQILERLVNMQTRLVIQRTLQGRRWLQLSDWREGQRIVRCVLDLTDQEPSRWLGFLEEMRQELAADLHDGPAQSLALWRLEEDSPASSEANQVVQERLLALRSPWLGDRCPKTLLQSWLESKFKACQLDFEWDEPRLELQQQSYRLLQVWAEELQHLWRLTHLKARVSARRCWLGWQGRPLETGRFSPILLEWSGLRAELSEGRLGGPIYRAGGGEIQVEWMSA